MLFSLQLVMPLDEAEDWLPLARSIVRDSPDSLPVVQKKELMRDLCGLLRGAGDQFHFGLWEYVEEPEDAHNDYWEWVEGTIVDIEEEEDDFDEDEDAYAFVTILLLMKDGGDAQARVWAESDRIPEGEEASRKAYERWLEVLPKLDYRSVISTVVFIRPGEDGFGIMAPMLQEEHYHHLVPVL